MTTETDKPTTPAAARPKPAGGYTPRPAGGGYAGKPGGPRPQGGPGGMRGRPPVRRRVCRICMEKTGGVDWKAVNFLRNFITERGKMLSARTTGTCSKCQRQLTRAIKRARDMALVPTSPI